MKRCFSEEKTKVPSCAVLARISSLMINNATAIRHGSMLPPVMSRLASRTHAPNLARVRRTHPQSNSATIEHLMFQYPEDPDEFQYYLASTHSAYSLMLGGFVEPIGRYAPGFDVENWAKVSLSSSNCCRALLAPERHHPSVPTIDVRLHHRHIDALPTPDRI